MNDEQIDQIVKEIEKKIGDFDHHVNAARKHKDAAETSLSEAEDLLGKLRTKIHEHEMDRDLPQAGGESPTGKNSPSLFESRFMELEERIRLAKCRLLKRAD